MRLRHIEVFNAIYTVGSVTGAAQYLNITQPTASKILKHAEEQIGFKLFRRIRGRLIPTEEADALYKETKRISEQVTSLQKIVRNIFEADKGFIKLSSVAALGFEHLPRAIIAFQKIHPEVHFEFQTEHYEHLVSNVLEQEKDISIAFNPQHQSGLEFIDLGVGEFVCIYSGDEFDNYPERIKISDITGKQFISIENSGPLGELLSKMLLESNISVQTKITAQTYMAALNLVALGGGIAIVDEFTATSHCAGNVKFKKFVTPIRFSVQAIHKEANPPSKLVRNFLDFFKKYLTTQSRKQSSQTKN